jgi:hypothetical protein
MRVARRGIFLTTPNRWFPVEFHTLLPFAHWLPQKYFHAVLRQFGMAFFADENHLNLVTRRDLQRLAGSLADFAVEVSAVTLGGWRSNLLLVGKRR